MCKKGGHGWAVTAAFSGGENRVFSYFFAIFAFSDSKSPEIFERISL